MNETFKLSENALVENYNEFITLLNKCFSGERLEKLLHMYSENELGARMVVAPASGRLHFHGCHVGGYIQHIYNVYKCSLGIKTVYNKLGGDCNFTDEELNMCIFHHDLGKLGDEDGEYYLPNESDWHIKNQGKLFNSNPNIWHMDVTHRALYLLQKYDIKLSKNEYMGIMCADGPFGPGEMYYKQFDADKCMKSNIANVMHWSDWMAAKIEYDRWRLSTQ